MFCWAQVANVDYQVVEIERSKVMLNTVTFEVLEGFKGVSDSQDFTVLDFSITCGPQLSKGATYLIFSSDQNEQDLPVVGGCSHFLYALPEDHFPSSDVPDSAMLDTVLEMIRNSI